MKKILAVALIITLLFSLSACNSKGNEDNSSKSSEITEISKEEAKPLSLYNASYKKLEESMENGKYKFSMDGTMNMDMPSLDMKQEVTIKADCTVDMAESKLSMDMKMGLFGSEMSMGLFSDGTYYYMSMLGQTMKAKINDELKKEIDDSANMGAMDLEDSVALEQTSEVLDDGSTKIIITVDPKTLTDEVKKSISGLMDSMPTEVGDMKYNSMKLEAIIDKAGELKSTKIIASYEMTVEEETITYDIDLDINYEDIGDDFKVTAPDSIDFESATEVSADELMDVEEA